MLKSISFKLQVQLTVEKGCHFQLSSIDEKLDLTDQELQKLDSVEVLNKAQACENV